jgi:Spy/CpxP family protein refolding chaperone
MRTWKWVLVLALSVAWAPAARAGEGVVPEGTTVQLLLLRQKSVQQELKLTPDVTRKIMEFTNKQHDAFLAAMKLGKAEAREKLKAMEEENQQFLKDTLTPGQDKRLIQITLQTTGLHQLSRPEVAKVLKLTKDQQQKFSAIQKAANEKLAKLLYATNPEERKERFAKLREETRKEVRALLTAEQKATVDELVGAPFNGDIIIEGPESVLKKKGR